MRARDQITPTADQMADILERAEQAAVQGESDQAVDAIKGALGQLTSVAYVCRNPEGVSEIQDHLAAAIDTLTVGNIDEGVARIRQAFEQLTKVVDTARQQNRG